MFRKRRLCIAVPIAISCAAVLEGCSTAPNKSTKDTFSLGFNAVVDPSFTSQPGEIKGGVAHFKTMQQALDAAPSDAAAPWRIAIRAGLYYEKLEVTKPNIHFIGDDRKTCLLTYDAYAGQKRPSGNSNWTTWGCASITVRAPGFAASNLTIENGFDYLNNDAKPPTDPTYTNDPQGVALMLATGSDSARIENVTLNGYQDTLFVDGGRSYFLNCAISGNVDFIFGAGQAVFETCDIISRPRRKPNVFPLGYITAPSTQIRNTYGLVFIRCKLLRESDAVPDKSIALGRPWHPAVNMPDGRYADPNAIGSSVFIDCFLDKHIVEIGWWSMTGQQKSGPDRSVFLPEDSRFFEHKSTGPGAVTQPDAKKRRQLNDTEAANYTLSNIFNGWKP